MPVEKKDLRRPYLHNAESLLPGNDFCPRLIGRVRGQIGHPLRFRHADLRSLGISEIIIAVLFIQPRITQLRFHTQGIIKRVVHFRPLGCPVRGISASDRTGNNEHGNESGCRQAFQEMFHDLLPYQLINSSRLIIWFWYSRSSSLK